MQRKTKIFLFIAITVVLCVVALVYSIDRSDKTATLAGPDLADTIPDGSIDTLKEEGSTDIEPAIEPDTDEDEFPETGNTINQFVLAPYRIAMQAEGLLDGDELADVALILQNKDDSTALRPTLVLLKQSGGGYKRYATSWHAIGPAYINGSFQQYDSEDVTIDKDRNLNINTSGGGPVGNKDLKYRFIDNQLVLVAMETYHMGAGGHTGVKYDFLKSTVSITEVNTMKENMPSTTKVEKLSKRKPFLFETTDPDSVYN